VHYTVAADLDGDARADFTLRVDTPILTESDFTLSLLLPHDSWPLL
jgi:hypothetical protein